MCEHACVFPMGCNMLYLLAPISIHIYDVIMYVNRVCGITYSTCVISGMMVYHGICLKPG